MTRLLACIGLVAIALSGPLALAQGFDGERFAPAVGAAGGLQVERAVVPQHLGYGLGLFLNLADDPVVARQRATGATLGKPLDAAFSADLLGSLGLFDWLELGVHLPVRLVWEGDSSGTTLNAAAGVGDLRFVPKVGFGWRGDATGGWALGLAAPVSLPTGRPEALRGAGVVSVEPRLLGLVYGARWFLSGSAGFRVRGKDTPIAPGHELTFGLAGTYTPAVADDAFDVQVDVVGGYLTNLEDPRRLARLPLEALAALVWRPAPRWSIYGGFGIGLTNAIAVPDARGLAGVRYVVGMPGRGGERDSDSDGVPDRSDRCPDDAEDLDGFQDDDGCPEADNDKDGVADDDDECPDDAEEPGGDKDGCPDRPKVIIRQGKMVIYGKVLFPSESADLSPKSEVLIDEMARALREHPTLRRIEIGGHTDSSGDEDYNLKLSRERAESVRAALIKRGIAPNRLVAKGYGESEPIAPNVTNAGRAKNRRVDFSILN